MQTFEVLKKVGQQHGFSAGLVIGGKELAAERAVIGRMNILVATPGRLLQHMDQTLGFEWSSLQMLVLDEADRILDLGFAKTLDAIVKQLPSSRQTLLFSATQTTDVATLARISLINPARVSVDASDASATPAQLKQSYLVCPLPEKLDRLFSFIKAHLQSKTLVFLSSCKQVRFVHEAFCALQPGVPLACLHGKQKQHRRLQIFEDFCKRKSAVLFATDIAARGLDFPAVDWVLQVDCPEDVPTYIHRVGRTARYEAPGSALLFLLPTEAPAMLEAFEAAKVPIAVAPKQNAPPKYLIAPRLQALCSASAEIKYLGQTALISYARSIHLQSNKAVFRVAELPLDAFAAAIGLPGTPKLRFVARSAQKNASRQLEQAIANASSDDEDEEGSASDEETEKRKLVAKSAKKSVERMFNRRNTDVLSQHFAKLRDDEEPTQDGGDADLFTLKRADHDLEGVPEHKGPAQRVSRRDRLLTLKRAALKDAPEPQRLVFDDEDQAQVILPYDPEAAFDRDQSAEMRKEYLQAGQQVLKAADAADAQRIKDLRRATKLDRKRKAKERATGTGAKQARLGAAEDYSEPEQDEE